MKVFLSCALCLAVLPAAVTADTKMFPGIKKRLQEKNLVAAQVKVKVPADGPVSVEEAAPAAVPAPMDAGADGFPELPAVSQMLSEASGTLKSVSSQASSLEARVVQAQMQSESKMAKQKAAFEEKLKLQEQGSQAVIDANVKITAEIKTLQGNNGALKKHAKEIEETNKVMRSELRTLESHLSVAKDFTAKSLTATDDSKNSLLQVLKAGKRKKHSLVETASSTHREVDDDDDDSDDKDDAKDDASDDGDDSDDSDEGSTSFLAISSKRVRKSADGVASFEAAMSNLESAVPEGPAMGVDSASEAPSKSPGDLLSVLSADVAHLAQQEKESEKTLKNLFIRDFRAGAKRHSALQAQQKNLIATRTSLQTLQAKLKSAETHLEATRTQLEGRLHGLGQYLQKLAHLAMAPQHEVPHLMEVLPKTVTVKAEVKKVL